MSAGNQRAAVTMTPAEVVRYLAERVKMVLATHNADRSIQLVAMYYGLLDGDLAFTAKSASQKIVNLRRDPSISVLVDDGAGYDDLTGVHIRGFARIVDEPERRRAVAISLFERRVEPYDESVHHDVIERNLHRRTVVRLEPTRTVSWDHRKLGTSSVGARKGT